MTTYPKVLFLDFDGVLHRGNTGTFRKLPLLEELMQRVPELVVVLSTNWRHSETLDDLQAYFSPALAPRVVDVLPILPDNLRGGRQREIEAWLAQHRQARQVHQFVALDDSADLFDANCPCLHLVDGREGLTPGDITALALRFH